MSKTITPNVFGNEELAEIPPQRFVKQVQPFVEAGELIPDVLAAFPFLEQFLRNHDFYGRYCDPQFDPKLINDYVGYAWLSTDYMYKDLDVVNALLTLAQERGDIKEMADVSGK